MAYKFNKDKYSLAEAVFNRIRSGAPCVRRVIHDDNSVKVWVPNAFSKEDYGKGQNSGSRVIDKLRAYLSAYCIGSTRALCSGTIGVSYMVMGDLGRVPVLGENTYGFNGEFDWDTMMCNVVPYSGQMSRLEISKETHDMISSGMNSRKRIQESTGWDVVSTQQMSVEDINSLSNLVNSAKAGHSKYTRLVKGLLLYIDLLHSGRQRFQGQIDNVISYSANPIITSFRARDRSYSYCSKPTSMAYVVLMYLVGLEYPYNIGGLNCVGNVTVPADAGSHYVVVNGVRTSNIYDCDITSDLVWIGMVNYAREMRVMEQFESALVTACSLYENRYIRSAGLPRVESTVDLIRPAFVNFTTEDFDRPAIDREMGVVIGRVHQMGMLLSIKDVIVSAQSSTDQGFNFSSIIRNMMSSQETIMMRMTEWLSPVSILTANNQMRWMSYLNDEDIADISSISIFEGLWLCNGQHKSIKGGVVDLLFHGINDMVVRNAFLDLLIDEANKININIDRNRIAKGRFSVKYRALYSVDQVELVPAVFREFQSDLVQACDYRPRGVVPLRRIRRGGNSRVKSDAAIRKTEEIAKRTIAEEIKAQEADMAEEIREYQWIQEEHNKEVEEVKKRGQGIIDRIKKIDGKRKSGVPLPGISKGILKDVRETKLGEVEHGQPSSVGKQWSKVVGDKGYDESMYDDVEHNLNMIIRSVKPDRSDHYMEWRQARFESMVLGEPLIPQEPHEMAWSEGPNYSGQVDLTWDHRVLSRISNSIGWKNSLRSRGVNTEIKVFQDDKSYYYMQLIMDGVGSIKDIVEIDSKFSGTTINVAPNLLLSALRSGIITRLERRNMRKPDSPASTKRVVEDGWIADWMYKDTSFAASLTGRTRNSLTRFFYSKPHERAALSRTVTEGDE